MIVEFIYFKMKTSERRNFVWQKSMTTRLFSLIFLIIKIMYVGTGKDYVARGIELLIASASCRAISIASWSALQMGQDSSFYILDTILGWVYDVIGHLISVFYTFFKILKYLRTNTAFLFNFFNAIFCSKNAMVKNWSSPL